MAQAKATGSSLASELLAAKLYKPNSGRIVRQVTAVTVALLIFACAVRAYQLMDVGDYPDWATYGLPIFATVAGIWFAFRLVNWPRFASFLIDVETEMQKVSWASWDYLVRATIVVLAVMVIIGVALLGFDLLWKTIFEAVGFLDASALNPETPAPTVPGAE